MSSTHSQTTYSSFYRRRTFGRAPSPPTWACYEQIPYGLDDYSDSGSDIDSCSEDDEDYGRPMAVPHDSDTESDHHRAGGDRAPDNGEDHVHNMDIDEANDAAVREKEEGCKKDVKGKQRAVDPPVMESPRKQQQQRRKHREPVFSLRPILTIQKSQGFVWNQDLFVPPYIKDRYVASTSPPNSFGFVSASASSTNSYINEYEVEVVEIRVKDGELHDIIP
ncbi:hypothetical protein GLOTRDRAFT_78105 [Gloeophyllum trabeum ATCC 11539]|uniref:Uncharacterized protein n=1 Tax=Gloeophyllum trabeum (strain ATCC 11539 / FP-39264 / Madison 617) TaxID=670483 RepID=S7RN48_GLOTA|nr:uncharacterized protein GLOTRDRAFT_78105 [Gloeophyllum trabeum ATCC 11539]EPQ54169.1 hypothetical protein GLOTRDRAFT_78105 [Gloeophyllum trabeum ATCC 11539]